MSEHQTFITSYQNNTIVGLALYLLFISFLAAETLTISYLTTKNQRNKQFHTEKTLIVILTAEVFYYLLIRLLNYKSQKKFLKKSTIIGSFHKIIANSQLYHSQPSETKDQHPYLHLTILTVTLIASQIIFSILVSQSIFIYHPEEENYLVSSIFWSAFALPYLFEHFYLSEVLYHDNPKQNFQFFPYIILAFMLETLLEGAFFLIFIVLKLINIYIQVKQSYYMLHINFVINSTLLIFTIFYVLLKFQNNDNGHLFSWHTVQNIWHVLLTGAIVTCSMLVSRFIGLFFLKQQLNKYFYTQMYIQLAFVFTTMLLYLSYVPQIQSNQNVQSITILLPLLFLLTVGFIVYKQGKQKLQVNMDLPNEEY